jgi:DNA-directed RNA polymerase specialized sigma subunit
MEKVVQSSVLIDRYKWLLTGLVNSYARKGQQSLKEDFFQEGVIGLLKAKHKFSTEPVLNEWIIAKRAIQRGIREFLRTYVGVSIDNSRPDRRNVKSPVSIEAMLGKTDSLTGEFEDRDALFEQEVVEQPSYEQKDLIEKLQALGSKILGGKEYEALFSDEEVSGEDSNRRRSNRYKAVRKMKDYVERNWK